MGGDEGLGQPNRPVRRLVILWPQSGDGRCARFGRYDCLTYYRVFDCGSSARREQANASSVVRQISTTVAPFPIRQVILMPVRGFWVMYR